MVVSCFKCSGMHKTVNCKIPKNKLHCSKCQMQNHTTEAHRELPGRSAPRVEAGEEVGVFTCYNTGTSFVDGGISLKNGGKTFFVNSKLLVDTGALMPSGIAISEDFYFQGMGGDVSRLGPSNLPNASGALANSTMKTVGQVNIVIKMPNINFFFEGSAVVLENLSLPVILGVNFLKTNSLSTILEPDTAKLVHKPTNQEQVLIANIKLGNFQKNKPPSRSRPQTRQKRSNRSKKSPPPQIHQAPPP